jgi:hypothetical protein
MRVGVIDAQGAGLAQAFIKMLRKESRNVEIIGLGTNKTASENMIKAGALEAVTGEESICEFLRREKLHCVVGPIGILCSGGIKGEITAGISEVVLGLECTKYIIPIYKHGIYIPGTRKLQLKEIFAEIVEAIIKSDE